jgi:1A family penicillin-binding protein
LLGVIIFFLGLVAASVGYIVLAAQLPSPDELRAREPDFASSRIYDRDGQLLYEIMDPNTGKRTYVPISQISRSLQLATVATEDRNFYDHVGFDPFAIARAVFYALQEREIVSGASTITQQVARNILLDPEERTEVSASRKIKEIVLAAELSRKYSKEEILEIYLNNNNYGNLAYGVDAAARTYFGTTAGNLTVGQAAFLAGLPQSPATYDPYGGGLDAALKRQRTVLALMVEAGFITQEQADVAAAEMAAYQFPSIYTDRIPAPHFVFYVRQWVEENLGADLLYQGGGLRIYTTLDAQLQTIAEQEVTQGVANLAGRNVTNGALVAVEPPTGYILAMVGSVDFYDQARGGQVNVILRCRQPGSAIKPLTYLTAFEKGWTPATIVWDVPTRFTDTAGNVYRPVNYDGRFRGATSVRTALANSLNIPAVRTLNFVSVDGLLAMSERLGVTSLVSPHLECPEHPYETRPFYGLALALGGGELKPLELTAAYATFANNGDYLEPTPILWIEDSEGNLLVDHRTRGAEQVVSPQHAYLVTHILADTQARCLVFHCPSILELPDRPVAAKTGTTNDNRDAWTVGYTPDLAVGVWVGNNDNSEMAGVVGSSGAGPIWNAFMQRAHEGIPPHPFPRPPGIVEREICTLSGTEPGRYCPEQRREIFYQQQLPPGEDKSWFQAVKIDAASGLRANAFCTSNVIEKVMLILDPEDESMVPHDPRLDPKGRRWLEQWAVQNNIEIAPKDYCTEGEQEPTVRIVAPAEREAVAGSVEIRGTVDIPEFDHYEITYGVGDNPQGWGWISGPHEAIVRDGLIGLWEAGSQEPGVYTVRVVAYNKRGTQFESHVVIVLEAPTPTPTPTSEDTATPTPTSSPQVTSTPTPTSVPPTATPTLLPPTPVPLTATPTSMPPTATMPPITETPTPMSTPPPQTPTPESTPTLPPQTPTSEPLPTLVPPVVESPTPQSNE